MSNVTVNLDLDKLLVSSNENVKYHVKYDQGLLKAFFSRKVMVGKFEPAEVSVGIEVPVIAEDKESLQKAAQEVMNTLIQAARPHVMRLFDEKLEGRR